jgi:hypothetical protein
MVEQTRQSPPPYASETLLRLAPPATPEDRLMLAVLLDAVTLLREHATGVRPHLQRLAADTARWVPDRRAAIMNATVGSPA